MSSVDERVVAMKMDYNSFDKGVSATTSALDKLKKALTFDKESKSLNDLDEAGKKFSLASIGAGVETIASKFGALSIIGITALTNIANKAVDAGLTIAKSLTIDPVKAGFAEYELKMGSIQTILANTARYGTQLGEVTANLEELNSYADKTIYNFGDMTKNIGLFTNAGIKIGDATSMIKGFSNEAAASGTSAQGAAGAAYQLSQALSAGTIRLMDWRSLQNVGMGNKNMQNGLIEIADAMGTLEANTIDAETVQKDFNGSLEKNWLSADVMSTYLKIMAGDYDAASMAALGLSQEQIAAFQAQAQMGQDAATKVRTWTQLIGTLQESVGSGWAQTFDILIGDFNEATDLWTAVNDGLGPIINAMAETRNNLLQGWKDLGGRNVLMESFGNIFKAVVAVMDSVKLAFTNVFPPTTAAQLLNITNQFRKFTEALIPSSVTMVKIRQIFEGLFAVLDIGWMVIKGVVGVIMDLFGSMSGVGGGALDVAAKIGVMLIHFRDAVKSGTALNNFFNGLSKILKTVIGWLGKLGEAVVSVVSFENFREVWEGIANAIGAVGRFLQPAVQWVKEAFANIKNAVTEFFKTMDFNVLIGLLNVGALGTAAVFIKKGFDKIVDAIGGIFKGGGGSSIKDMIKDVFGSITDTFKTMQATLKSTTLLAIAGAIALMTASVVTLSMIDTGQLFISLGAMGIMFGQLSAAMVILDKFAMSGGVFKMAVLGGAMIGLATAMVLLAAAAKIMSTMDWNEMARGIVGLAGGMTLMVGALAALDRLKFSPAGAGQIFLLSAALVVIASAFKIMSTLSWDDIGRSLAAMGGALIGLTGVMVIMDKMKFSPAGAASILGMSVALTVVAGALKVFATMSWDEIGRAMVVFGGVILGFVGALLILDTLKSSPVGAATMIAMAVAINLLIPPMKAFSSMSWDEIGRAMTVLAGSLLILAGAMFLMGLPPVLLGAVGIVAAAGALMMLAPAMKLLGTMSWDDIGRGLTVLGGALAILAVGGVLLIPAIPAFLGLGVAIALIGAGTMAAGIGLAAMATGITALAAAGTVGAEAIKMAVTTLIGLIPEAMATFAQGIIDFALVIAGGAVEFTAAMTTLLQSLLNAINVNAPLIIDTLWNLVVLMTEKLVEGVPYFVDAAMRLMTNFLNTIANRIPELAAAATNVVVAFVTSIGDNAPKVADAAAKTIVKFVDGIADAIENNKAALRAAAGRLSDAIIDGMTFGLSSRIGEVAEAAARVAKTALNAAKQFLGINSPSKEFFKLGGWSSEGLANGITKNVGMVVSAGKYVGEKVLDSTAKVMAKISDSISADINLNPVITPILDLSQIKRDAQFDSIFNAPQLDLSASISGANMAYDENERTKDLIAAASSVREGDTYNYTQNNTSPKALSEAEIYRQTKNQLATTPKKKKE